MSQVHHRGGRPGPAGVEQLGLFAAEIPAEPQLSSSAAPASAAPGAVVGPGTRESNDMALVAAVLAATARHGYFLTGDGQCWRAGTETGEATDDVALVEPPPGEAAMVAQLLARGWLLRANRTRRRAGIRRGRSSGRRRVELDVHQVTVAAAARAAASRWHALAALPTQRRSSAPGETP